MQFQSELIIEDNTFSNNKNDRELLDSRGSSSSESSDASSFKLTKFEQPKKQDVPARIKKNRQDGVLRINDLGIDTPKSNTIKEDSSSAGEESSNGESSVQSLRAVLGLNSGD